MLQQQQQQQMTTTPQFDGVAVHHQISTITTSPAKSLDQHCRLLEEENLTLRESETRLRQQHVESQRRERILVRRLAAKEQEMQDYSSQIAELKSQQAPGPNALRTALLDPAVNILFQKLKGELQATKAKMEETQNELSAWKFTPDSNNGKRLMAKCRLLHQENEELGKMTSNGRLAKLEGDLALQKSFSEEVKKSQSELDDFLQELDEDVEGMQSTIFFLQQELKAAKDTITSLESEVNIFKTSSNGDELYNKVNGNTNLIVKSEMDVKNLNLNETSEQTRTSNNIIINNGLKHNNNTNNNDLRTNNKLIHCNGDDDVSVAEITKCDEQINIENKSSLVINIVKSNISSNNNQLVNNNKRRITRNNHINYDDNNSDSSEHSNKDGEPMNKKTNKKNAPGNKKQRRPSALAIDLDDSENMNVDDTIDNLKLSASAATPSNGTVKNNKKKIIE